MGNWKNMTAQERQLDITRIEKILREKGLKPDAYRSLLGKFGFQKLRQGLNDPDTDLGRQIASEIKKRATRVN